MVCDILTQIQGTIGRNKVTVPKYYYKVIYDPKRQGKMIAFLMPNENSSKPLKDFVVTVDSLERMTGIDFFPELPDIIESALESQICSSEWFNGS
jgi:endonuclease G